MRRQLVLSPYVVDFFVPAYRLGSKSTAVITRRSGSAPGSEIVQLSAKK